MTTRRSTKTTTHRAERKWSSSSSSSSSAFCDACVYIIKSLTEVLFNNNREIQLLNKYLSSFSLVRCVLARGQRSKNLKPEIAQIYIRSLSFASKSDWLMSLSINPPFFKRVQFKSKYSFVVYLIHNRRDQWQGEGGQKMSTRHLDYDPDRRARESGREEAEVLDARRLVYVEPWYRKLWRWIHFF